MKVTLRKFLEIVGNSLIETYLCKLYIEVTENMFQDIPEFIETYEKQIKFNGYDGTITNIRQLDPYLDYEILGFDQRVQYGEVIEQMLTLREIKE